MEKIFAYPVHSLSLFLIAFSFFMQFEEIPQQDAITHGVHCISHDRKKGHRSLINKKELPAYIQQIDPSTSATTISPVTQSNPWQEVMGIYDIPKNHGAGVYVDLGGVTEVNGIKYREPSGKCPNYGKYIKTSQPTNNVQIYPNNYLARVPSQYPQHTPLGGGFQFPQTQPQETSPVTISQILEMLKNGNLSEKINVMWKESKNDELALCALYAYAIRAQNSEYRYPFAYDTKTSECYILYVAMQQMEGTTYCTKGDAEPKLTWYCFEPFKDSDHNSMVYGSPHVSMDYKSSCPQYPIKYAHFGAWNGNSCMKIKPEKTVQVQNADECGLLMFKNSASDQPSQFNESLFGQIMTNLPSILLPIGDQAVSDGVGLNYANYHSSEQLCELFSTVPDCFYESPGDFAFVSLAYVNSDMAVLPTCTHSNHGWSSSSSCICEKGYKSKYRCIEGAYVEVKEKCSCVNPWLIAGPILGVAFLIFLVLGLWIYDKKRRQKTSSVYTVDVDEEAITKNDSRRKRLTDCIQEAEPSFWGENAHDETQVTIEADY